MTRRAGARPGRGPGPGPGASRPGRGGDRQSGRRRPARARRRPRSNLLRLEQECRRRAAGSRPPRPLSQLGRSIRRVQRLLARLRRVARDLVSLGHGVPGLRLVASRPARSRSGPAPAAPASTPTTSRLAAPGLAGRDPTRCGTGRPPRGDPASSARSIRTIHSPFIGLVEVRALDRLDRLGELLLPDQERDADLEQLSLRGRRLRLGSRPSSSFVGLVRVTRAAQQVGPEQVPVAGQSELGRGLSRAGPSPRSRGTRRPSEPAGSRSARSARAWARRNRRLSPRAWSFPWPVIERSRSIASSSRAIACSRGLGSAGASCVACCQLRACAHRNTAAWNRSCRARGRSGFSFVNQSSRSIAWAQRRRRTSGSGDDLRRPIERRGHVQRQLLAAVDVDRRIVDLGC